MDEKFKLIIRDKLNLDMKSPIVIGFSGGVDSVCLATLFLQSSIPIIIAHFNHCLRETADRDEDFAREFAQKRNLIFVSEKSDVSKFAKANRLSHEEAARKKRYEFLFRIAKNYHSKTIAVAHHADDQIETVLMHLFRGSGMAGLLGMREEVIIPEFDSIIKIIRPLLSFWREEIEHYCYENKHDFVVDETNLSILYERNKIRNEILPYLQQHYPGLKNRIFRMSKILINEDDIVQELLQKNWRDVCNFEGSYFVILDQKIFSGFPIALQRRIIRRAVFSIKPDCRDLSFDNIERVIEFLINKKPGEIDLHENLIALFSSTEIIVGSKTNEWLSILYPQLEERIIIEDLKDKTISISNYWELSLEKIGKQEDLIFSNIENFVVYVDADQFLEKQIILRNREKGDRFQPLGMEIGKVKISDFFINEKLLKPARDKWPVLTNKENEIIWVPGFRQNHKSKITNQTENILKISVTKKEK